MKSRGSILVIVMIILLFTATALVAVYKSLGGGWEIENTASGETRKVGQ